MYTRKQGGQAIVDLQKMANIEVPLNEAEDAWDTFSDHDKENTEIAHKIFCPPKKTAGS